MLRYAWADCGDAYSFRVCHYVTTVVAEGPAVLGNECSTENEK